MPRHHRSLACLLAIALVIAPIASKTLRQGVPSGRLARFRQTVGLRLQTTGMDDTASNSDSAGKSDSTGQGALFHEEKLRAIDHLGRNQPMSPNLTLLVFDDHAAGRRFAVGVAQGERTQGSAGRMAEAGTVPLRCSGALALHLPTELFGRVSVGAGIAVTDELRAVEKAH